MDNQAALPDRNLTQMIALYRWKNDFPLFLREYGRSRILTLKQGCFPVNEKPIKLETVLKHIAQAFPLVPLDPTDAFAGYGETYLDAEDFFAGTRHKVWTAFEIGFLEFHQEVLLFLSPKAFCSFLPAFLKATAEYFEDSDMLPDFVISALTRPDDAHGQSRFDAQIGPLTQKQSEAVAMTLAYCNQFFKTDTEENLAAGALKSHWQQVL